MTDTQHIFERIALALERLAPPVETTLLGTAPAYRWNGKAMQSVPDFKPLDLALLRGIDAQKTAMLENGRRLASGYSAHDILLWGARGAGKSALVKSTVAALVKENLSLRLVEASGEDLASLPNLFALLAKDDRPMIVFFDDLGFEGNGDAARHLRSVLDGGVAARPAHVRLYVTSNRRHILPRSSEEQASAINPRDVVDDQLALADRFGLSLGFHVCDQNQYLAMVAGYAAHIGIPFDPADALLWAAQRGARSGRIAWHYAIEIAGRAGKVL